MDLIKLAPLGHYLAVATLPAIPTFVVCSPNPVFDAFGEAENSNFVLFELFEELGIEDKFKQNIRP